MNRLTGYAAGLTILAMAGCATNPRMAAPDQRVGELSTAAADLRDAAGQTRARATISQIGDDLRVRVESVSMTPDAYGVHIHRTGHCDPPAFESAGPHWNPTGQEHGKDNPRGMHKGDLPNLLVGADGRGSFEVTVPNAWVSGSGDRALIDADGAAIVVHARADDYRTDPSGNSGARIACGIIR